MATNSTTLSAYSGLPLNREVDNWVEFLFRLQMSDIDEQASVTFMRRAWLVSVYFSAVYIVVVFAGVKLMQNRAPFNLRLPLAVWSGALCLFSLIGTIQVWPEFVQLGWSKGLVATYCDNSYRHDNSLMYWYTLFVLSKQAELIDTGFIILRKQKLLTLHWIHHVLTLIYCFYVYRDQVSTARWMVAMNFAIHTIMYGYYALRALKISVPRPIAFSITTMQIVQMLFGFFINIHTLIFNMSSENSCQCSLRASVSGFLLYGLFFYYFVRFFFDAYFQKSATTKQSTSEVSHHLGQTKQQEVMSSEKCSDDDLNNNDRNLLPKKTN